MSLEDEFLSMESEVLTAFGGDVISDYGILSGIFSNPTKELELKRLKLKASQPVVELWDSDAKLLKKGDALTIQGKNYHVAKLLPDDTGMTIIHLLPEQTGSPTGNWR